MPSTYLCDADPGLRHKFSELSDAFHTEYAGWRMLVVCTYRSPAEQFETYKLGRVEQNGKWLIADAAKIRTNKDGYKLKSRHNDSPSGAIDVEVYGPDKKKFWNTKKSVGSPPRMNPWLWLRDEAPKYGLLCGGAWQTLPDYPHFQLA
jgi:hypothetical protein